MLIEVQVLGVLPNFNIEVDLVPRKGELLWFNDTPYTIEEVHYFCSSETKTVTTTYEYSYSREEKKVYSSRVMLEVKEA